MATLRCSDVTSSPGGFSSGVPFFSYMDLNLIRVPLMGPHFLFLAFPTGLSSLQLCWGSGFKTWVYIVQSIVGPLPHPPPPFSSDDSLCKVRNQFLGAAFLSLYFR